MEMRRLLVEILLLLTVVSYAGQRVITDTREEVILHTDGTWKYADKSQKQENKIRTNATIFKKPADSKFLVRSTVKSARQSGLSVFAFLLPGLCRRDKYCENQGSGLKRSKYELAFPFPI
jgi:hypothetical protein